MKPYIEPLILYLVLFLRFSLGITALEDPAEFSANAEITRIIVYILPSLALVWYLLLKAKRLKEWDIGFPHKKDFFSVFLAFPAMVLIGITISQVSLYFGMQPDGIRPLPPQSAASWALLGFSSIGGAYLEESYFRFYLLSKQEEMGLGPHRAVLLSTVLFSLCHIYQGPWGFLNSALSGVTLAFLFLRFRSLHGLACAHALHNIMVYILGSFR